MEMDYVKYLVALTMNVVPIYIEMYHDHEIVDYGTVQHYESR